MIRELFVLGSLLSLAPIGLAADLHPALWDSVTALHAAVGSSEAVARCGAVLPQEQEVEPYLQNQRFWTERRLARTLAIEDPTGWRSEEIGPDLVLRREAQVLRVAAWILGPDGILRELGPEAGECVPFLDSPCAHGLERLSVPLPDIFPHTLLRWEVVWREPGGTTRTVHEFGGRHPILESRFSLAFPKGFLDTDWGQMVRPVGPIPAPEVVDEVGPLKGNRRYLYQRRFMAAHPEGPFSLPRAQRIPHLVLLPEDREGRHDDLLLFYNRIEASAVLRSARRDELLAGIRDLPREHQAAALHARLRDRVRVIPVPLDLNDFAVREAEETWRGGCGTPVDFAALYVAALRELGHTARTLLARSREAGPADTVFLDPGEFDAVLVEIAPDPSVPTTSEAIVDPACSRCAYGYFPARLHRRPAATLDRGSLRWRLLPGFDAETHWVRRVLTAVVEVEPASPGDTAVPADRAGSKAIRLRWEDERTLFGEPALLERNRIANPRTLEPDALVPGTPVSGREDLDAPLVVRHQGDARVEAEEPERYVLPALGSSPVTQLAGWAWFDSARAGPLSDRDRFLGLREHETLEIPHPFVLLDSVSIQLPAGWKGVGLPEPTLLQGAGFQFLQRCAVADGRLTQVRRLFVNEIHFPGARARDLLELARAVARSEADWGALQSP